MSQRTLKRRTFLKGAAAGAAAGTALASFPWAPAIAQNAPVKVGLLTVKTGPLAQGGIQMEQGLSLFFKDKNNKIAGRNVELIVADTGGNPAGTKAKAQELIERDQIDVMCGPLAAFEMLAISDYVIEHKMPTLALAGAENVTQRKPNPYFLRVSATSSQAMHPMADYASKVMGLKNVITISEDFAFGYEQIGGFQQVFEDLGGKVAKKLWTPIVTPDYTPFLAQIEGVDGVVQGFAGSNPIRFMQQYANYGLKKKFKVVGGETAGDDALLKSFGDDAIGLTSACPYSYAYESESNKKFVAGMVKISGGVPGFYAAALYMDGMCIEEALKKTGGKTDDKDALITALRAVSIKESPRGPFHFDHFGNVVGNIFVRRVEKINGKLANPILKTYHNVSQFWTYPEDKFLAQPVYSRDWPPLKA
jgi:branched-chain amino acid transport system substrate-binding protein